MYEDSERVPVKVAAKELGVAPAEVHYRMITGEWDLGRVDRCMSGKRNRYLIFRSKLNRFLEKEV